MVDQVWIVNASPLISLAKIGRLELLIAAHRQLIIPQAVFEEILVGEPDDPARVALERGFGNRPLHADVDAQVAEWGLGRGESAVLSIAGRQSATAVVDDRDARRAAKALGVAVIGTLGVILRARAEHRIVSAAEVLRVLRQHGFRLDNDLIAAALRDMFDEPWEP